ncbi:MAG: hypothetical protein LBO74_11050 [Candidatus Symbiothrix sp.]|jgi:hypothetical protein|nr:hypothetical protein [Candidatus Symbiothrix sp.]
MPAKKLPDTDEERIKALQLIIEQEELNRMENPILSPDKIHEYRTFLLSFENARFCLRQAQDDAAKADKSYTDFFKSAQLYISHFIQVLNLAIIRNEVKAENLMYYGIEDGTEFHVPDLSTEDAILEWGRRLTKGEMERTSRGGVPIYNPAISKVIVHYDLFKDAIQSLTVYQKNILRAQEKLDEMREKIDRMIWDTWTKVEFKYWELPVADRKEKFREYGIQFHHPVAEQLDVFS